MVVTLFFLEIKRNLYSPPKNKDSNFSLVEKAPYRIWTDDLRLTMALLYHWVKRACFIRFMNYSLFPLWVYCIIYVHDIYIYAHNIYIVHLGAINLIYPQKVKSGQIFYFFFDKNNAVNCFKTDPACLPLLTHQNKIHLIDTCTNLTST